MMDATVRRIVTAGAILLGIAAVLLHIEAIPLLLGKLLHVFRPLLLGILFASMLSPAYERLCADFGRAADRRKIQKRGWIRPISLFGAMLPPVLVLVSIICILIPQIMNSVRLISDNLSLYSDNLRTWFSRYSETRLAQLISPEQLEAWLAAFQNDAPALLRKTYDRTAALLEALLDIGIGAVFSLYLLADKPRLFRQMMQLCGSFPSRARLLRIWERGRLICNTFARFLSSQCKESLILGVMCWLGMQMFHFPYPVLISAVIGITNIVPYIGPLAGTVPCALLLLMVQPRAVIWFLLFILLLQQIESNLIYPRVVGHSIGLPPAWVLAAIVTGGGLFGMAGLLLGVPLAAVLYTILFPDEESLNA
ncbi:MAG: AI-2E family transporter [Oscillospiraceae bacterium]|nr:AI-2E family transporter [Oscillospiraceae bacterium]